MYISKKKHSPPPAAPEETGRRMTDIGSPFTDDNRVTEKGRERIPAFPVPPDAETADVSAQPATDMEPWQAVSAASPVRLPEAMPAAAMPTPEARLDSGDMPLTEDTGELAEDGETPLPSLSETGNGAAQGTKEEPTYQTETEADTASGTAVDEGEENRDKTDFRDTSFPAFPAPYPSAVALGDTPTETETTDYDTFLRLNKGEGNLRIQASAGDQSIPQAGILIEVYRDFSDGRHIFYRTYTDMNGVADGLRLPAPPRENSLIPEQKAPYVTYTVSAQRAGDAPLTVERVPVFSGVTSIQPITLSSPTAGQNGSAGSGDTVQKTSEKGGR